MLSIKYKNKYNPYASVFRFRDSIVFFIRTKPRGIYVGLLHRSFLHEQNIVLQLCQMFIVLKQNSSLFAIPVTSYSSFKKFLMTPFYLIIKKIFIPRLMFLYTL